MESTPIVVLVCRHFAEEANAAIRELELSNVICRPFAARCGRPPVSFQELETAALDKDTGAADASKIVFGGCCINEVAKSKDKHPGFLICQTQQCFEMVAGKTFVEDLISKGSF